MHCHPKVVRPAINIFEFHLTGVAQAIIIFLFNLGGGKLNRNKSKLETNRVRLYLMHGD
jgi:hypothetical protein